MSQILLTVFSGRSKTSRMKSPISDFIKRMHSFAPIDIAVLFGLVAMQEEAKHDALITGGLISPSAKRRMWPVEASPEELTSSIARLESSGEVEWSEVIVGDGRKLAGYRVVRFEELRGKLMVSARTKYSRDYQRARRGKEKALTNG